jgi:hypothetical protein
MLKKQLTLLFAMLLIYPLVTAVFAQETPAKAEQAKWEGKIVRSSKEDSTLTVRKIGSTEERTVQYHGDPKTNDIDVSQVKDGDRVICTGTWDKPRVLHATLISKRLSHSQ